MASDFVEHPSHYLPSAPVILPVPAERSGWLASCATRDLGMVVVELGGGRRKPSDTIDPSVGISDILPLGAKVGKGEPIASVHAASRDEAELAVKGLRPATGLLTEPQRSARPLSSELPDQPHFATRYLERR